MKFHHFYPPLKIVLATIAKIHYSPPGQKLPTLWPTSDSLLNLFSDLFFPEMLWFMLMSDNLQQFSKQGWKQIVMKQKHAQRSGKCRKQRMQQMQLQVHRCDWVKQNNSDI